MARFQRGTIRKETRSDGETWVLRYYATRQSDGKRVERKLVIGLVRDFKTESAVWAEIDRLHVHEQINQPSFKGRVLFNDLAQHYLTHELPKRALTTQYLHDHIVRSYLDPRWGKCLALAIKPLEIEQWLNALRDQCGLANPTRAKLRQLMSRFMSTDRSMS